MQSAEKRVGQNMGMASWANIHAHVIVSSDMDQTVMVSYLVKKVQTDISLSYREKLWWWFDIFNKRF